MAEIDQIQVGDDTYDIRDATARQRTIPSGGSTGQYLKKKSATSYDTEWGSFGSLAEKDTADWTNDVSNKPSSFPPSSHTHDDRYYTESEVNSLLAAKANTADLGGLADKDKVDWDTDIDDIPQSFPPSSHTHDDRYYTESETNSLLNGKANTSHNHDGVYAPSSHTHDDRYYTESEIDTKLADKADSDDLGELADHDTVDYATEVTGKPTLGTMSAVNDAPSDSKEYVRKDGAWAEGTDNAMVELYSGTYDETINAGSVVYADNGFRTYMYKAWSNTTKKLYILSEDCPKRTSVRCFHIPGTVCPVLCDTDAVAKGDLLGVSGDGMCHALEPSTNLGRATVGIALQAKASGSTGTVMTRLVSNPTVSAYSESTVPTTYGTCFTVTGSDTSSIIFRVAPVKKGKMPFGVQANKQTGANGYVLLHTHQNEQVAVLADETEIRVGDWLVPSATTEGHVRNGSGYGIGEALTPKAAGASGLVKVHLNLKYGISTRAWWLPCGMAEDQVIGAWHFVGRANETESLLNVNNGTEYPLINVGAEWYTSLGFSFKNSNGSYLSSVALKEMSINDISAVAFGFSGLDIDTSNKTAGGYVHSRSQLLLLRGINTNVSYNNKYTMRGRASNVQYLTPLFSENGVLAANYGSSSSAMFYNGELQSTTTGGTTGDVFGGTRVWGQSGSGGGHVAFNMNACVMYRTELTVEQHLELANNIRALGGIS